MGSRIYGSASKSELERIQRIFSMAHASGTSTIDEYGVIIDAAGDTAHVNLAVPPAFSRINHIYVYVRDNNGVLGSDMHFTAIGDLSYAAAEPGLITGTLALNTVTAYHATDPPANPSGEIIDISAMMPGGGVNLTAFGSGPANISVRFAFAAAGGGHQETDLRVIWVVVVLG